MKKNPACAQPKVFVALIVTVLALFEGMALAQQRRVRNDEPADVAFARVPEKARAKPNPFENNTEATAAGKKLFEQHCAECHGETADGSNRGPSLRVSRVGQATAGEVFWILTNGVVRRGMPAWSKLPEPQRWQIAAFLRGLRATPAGTGTSVGGRSN
jgi:mono/diheme cytochrome c family protein